MNSHLFPSSIVLFIVTPVVGLFTFNFNLNEHASINSFSGRLSSHQNLTIFRRTFHLIHLCYYYAWAIDFYLGKHREKTVDIVCSVAFGMSASWTLIKPFRFSSYMNYLIIITTPQMCSYELREFEIENFSLIYLVILSLYHSHFGFSVSMSTRHVCRFFFFHFALHTLIFLSINNNH